MRKLNIINNVNTKSDSMMMTSGHPPGSSSPGDLHLSDQALSLCSPPLTVSTSSHLQSLYGHCPPGTVVFLQPEQTLVFKVDVGWRYIVVMISLDFVRLFVKLNFFIRFQAGALVSNPDGSTNTHLKDDDTYVYDSGKHSDRNYNWKK